MLNYFLSRYATDAVISKATEDIRNVEKGSLKPFYFSQKLWDPTLRCGGIYKEQTLRGFFVEENDLSIGSTMRHWWTDIREAILENLAYQAQFLLDL